jgi:post-segregation antitoxin (ccd killing protein)
MDQLAVLAKARGLKVAQLVRIAIAEYIRREVRKK